MANTDKINCPDCGATMNHHASKVDYHTDEQIIHSSPFSGALTEIHTCPECGSIETRVVP